MTPRPEDLRFAQPVMTTTRRTATSSHVTSAPQSHNYVVFDPSIVDIMKKYGLAGLAPLAGYGAMQQGQPSPQM